MMRKNGQYILVITTCPDTVSAKAIAQYLIVEKLAACVNVLPQVQSFFSWNDTFETTNENMLVIKTISSNYEVLQTSIKEMHPYEIPEIIAISIETGLSEYLNWVSQNVKQSKSK